MNDKTAKELLEKVKTSYNEIASEFDTSRKHDWKEFKMVLPFIKNGDRIVDLGCGNGRLLSFLKKNGEFNYTGIDNSENLLEMARSQHKGAKFMEGDFLKIPIKDNSQDAVVAIASFHHIPSNKLRAKALQRIRKTLRPGGNMILTVWNLFQPKYKKYIWKSRIKSILTLGRYDSRDTFIPWGKQKTMRYYYAFKPNELRSLIEKNGFKILKEITGNNITIICQKY